MVDPAFRDSSAGRAACEYVCDECGYQGGCLRGWWGCYLEFKFEELEAQATTPTATTPTATTTGTPRLLSLEDADEFYYPPPDDELELLDPRPPSTSALPLSSKCTHRNFDWVKAETNWDTSVPLTMVEQVGEGGWVGWKVGCFFL